MKIKNGVSIFSKGLLNFATIEQLSMRVLLSLGFTLVPVRAKHIFDHSKDVKPLAFTNIPENKAKKHRENQRGLQAEEAPE